MTKKTFFSLRRQLMIQLMEQGRKNGYSYSFKNIDRMDVPRFGSKMMDGSILRTYEQAWDCMKSLRDAVGFDK